MAGNLPMKSGNLRQNSKRQGICCLKFIFSQVEDPNFKNLLGQHAPNCLGLTVELNFGLEKSGNFILSGKWQLCPGQDLSIKGVWV